MRLGFGFSLALVVASAVVGCSDDTAVAPTPTPKPDGGAGGGGGGGGVAPTCPTGTVRDQGSCRPVGVPADGCGPGFEHDGNAGCTPILPDAPCPPGQMAVLGETACRSVAPCGRAPWGDIPVDAETVYVDASFTATDADGSAAKPFAAIQDGISAAADGAIVAVAAGSYAEDLVIQVKKVVLWGRCPELVEVVGSATATAALGIVFGATGTEVRDMAFRGDAVGIAVSGQTDVLLDRVRVHDTASRGVVVQDTFGATSLTVSRSLVEASHEVGLLLYGAAGIVEESIVRGTLPQGGKAGRGIVVEPGESGAAPSCAVRASILEGNYGTSFQIAAGNGSLEGSVVRGTEASGPEGRGVSVEGHGFPSTAKIDQSVLLDNREVGIAVLEAHATIDRTVVRGTRFNDGATDGIGIDVESKLDAASATVQRSLIVDNHTAGIAILGAAVELEDVVVRATGPAGDSRFGNGVFFETSVDGKRRATGTVQGVALEGNRTAALFVAAADLVVTSSAFRGTVAQASDGLFGDGVAVSFIQGPASVDIVDTEVVDNARAGLSCFGAQARVRASIFDCNAFELEAELWDGTACALEDAGGNLCGCDDAARLCQTSTAMLAPPEPVPGL